MTKKTAVLLFLAVATALPLGAQRVELILDGSGSMWGEAGGEAKIVAARRAMTDLVSTIQLAPDATLGLTVYGHRSKGDCADIEHFPRVSHARRSELVPLIEGIQPKGKTPIAESLRIVGDSLKGEEETSSIVLVSDGIESCGQDPCEVARRLREEHGIDVVIHVVGFDVREGQEQLECIAERGGGLFVTAENRFELEDALAQVEREVVKPAAEPKPEPINVAAAHNGGRVLLCSSHSSHWRPHRLIDGAPEGWMSYGGGPQSIVFGFADGRRAKIADLMINPYNDQGTPRWAKEVMVFGSHVSPFEGFELWGALSLEPIPSEQILTFEPPAEARYVKLNFMTSHGGGSNISAGEVMMLGWLLDDEAPHGPQLSNLASAAAGATIKTTSHSSGWKAENLIDEAQGFWASHGAGPQEATIRLAGEGPRRVHLVAISPYSSWDTPRWAREIEVLTSVASPYKGFVSQGQIELQPVGEFQVLRLPEPVTARYLKVRFLSNHGDGSHIAANEIVVLGE